MHDEWMGKKGFDEADYYEDSLENDDPIIEERILEAFRRTPSLCMTDIHVTVHAGVVTLDGEIQGPEEKKQAADFAYTLSGVKAVINHLSY